MKISEESNIIVYENDMKFLAVCCIVLLIIISVHLLGFLAPHSVANG